MKINADPTVSLREKIIQEAAAEPRTTEKALTQITSGELGADREDRRISDKTASLALAMDSTRLSSAAMARYRAEAGAKAADEQPQNSRKEESFSHKSYVLSEESRAAEWKRRIEAARGDSGKKQEQAGEADAATRVGEPQRKSDTESSTASMDTSGTEQAGGGAGGQSDAATEVRQRIKEVQRMLTAAQERLSQAAAKINEAKSAGDGKNASAESSDPGASTLSAMGKATQGRAEMAAAQSELAAAESEVNSLAGELMKLYQQLMKTSQGNNQ